MDENTKAPREVKIGQHVIFNDGDGVGEMHDRDALVTAVHSPTCINVVCICKDETSNDYNGRIPGDAFTSVEHQDHSTIGFSFRFADEEGK
ncbi:MAG: hypothetical protein KAS32_11595 [Candidatus Peribacteraceae bacterium]|nr:hypothetical protein [Candidatus Peribacteraceae bacterium]